MENKLKVLVKRVGEPAKVEHIDKGYKALQQIVGGYIEMPFHPDLPKDTSIVINEEGKLENLPPNIYWGNSDVICGDFLIVGIDEEGDSISLTDEQIKEAAKFIEENEASSFKGDAGQLMGFEVMSYDNDEDFLKALMGISKAGKSKESKSKTIKAKDDMEM